MGSHLSKRCFYLLLNILVRKPVDGWAYRRASYNRILQAVRAVGITTYA